MEDFSAVTSDATPVKYRRILTMGKAGAAMYLAKHTGEIDAFLSWLLPSSLARGALPEALDWASWVLCVGDPLVVLPEIQEKTSKAACGTQWKHKEYIYKCKDCERDPTAAICVACFQAGDHKNHDYALVRSGGGCCDCGDPNAWKPSGFCQHHAGASLERNPRLELPDLVRENSYHVLVAVLRFWIDMLSSAVVDVPFRRGSTASASSAESAAIAGTFNTTTDPPVVPVDNAPAAVAAAVAAGNAADAGDPRHLVARSQAHLHGLDDPPSRLRDDFPFSAEATSIVGWLTSISKTGDALIRTITDVLLTPPASGYTPVGDKGGPPQNALMDRMLRVDDDMPESVRDAMHDWYYFQLPDPKFKRAFARYYIALYPTFMSQILKFPKKNDDNDLASFGVQLFTIGMLVPVLAREASLLNVLISSFIALLNRAVAPRSSSTPPGGGVVDLEHDVLRDRLYWRVSCDMQYALTHITVSKYLVYDRPDLLDAWLKLLSMTQAMNPQAREAGPNHIEYENQKWLHAFNLDLVLLPIQDRIVEGFISGENRVEPGMPREQALAVQSPSPALLHNVQRVLLHCSDALATWLRDQDIHVVLPPGTVAPSPSASRPRRSSSGAGGSSRVSNFLGWFATLGNSSTAGGQSASSGARESLRRSASVGSSGSTRSTRSATARETAAATAAAAAGTSVSSLGSSGGSQHAGPMTSCGFIRFDVLTQPISFHIPLNRIIAVFLAEGTQRWRFSIQDMLSIAQQPPGFAVALIEHPLRILVVCAQIFAGLWVRNGYSIRRQADTYRHALLHDYSYDLDLFMMQVGAVLLGPDLIPLMLHRFQLSDWFDFDRPNRKEREADLFVAEQFLKLLIILATDRSLTSESDPRAILRKEVIHQLMLGDQAHSQITEVISRRLLAKASLDDVLKEVARYKAASGMQQGRYSLRTELWEEFDPYHKHFTPTSFQKADELWQAYLKKEKRKSTMKSPPKLPPLIKPFATLPIALQTSVLHRVLYTVLANAKNQGAPSRFCSVSLLSTAVYLLHICVDSAAEAAAAAAEEAAAAAAAAAAQATSASGGAAGFISSLFGGSRRNSAVPTPAPQSPTELAARHAAADASPSLPSSSPPVASGSGSGSGNSSRHRGRVRPAMDISWPSSTDVFVNMVHEVDAGWGSESMLSLLLALSKTDSVADMREPILAILRMCRDRSSICRAALERLAPGDALGDRVDAGKPAAADDAATKGMSPAEKAKAAAKARQAAIMAKFRKQQEAFQSAHKQMLDDAGEDDGDIDDDEQAHVCSLCHAGAEEKSSPLSMVAWIQRSKLTRIVTEQSLDLRMTSAQELLDGGKAGKSAKGKEAATATGGAAGDGTNATAGEVDMDDALAGDMSGQNTATDGYLTDEGDAADAAYDDSEQRAARTLEEHGRPVNDTINTVVQFCGHVIHHHCFSTYFSQLRTRHSSNMAYEGRHLLDLERGQYLCPECRQVSNSLLPLIDDVPVTYAERVDVPMPSRVGTHANPGQLRFARGRDRTQESTASLRAVGEAVAEFADDIYHTQYDQERPNYHPSELKPDMSAFLWSALASTVGVLEASARGEEVPLVLRLPLPSSRAVRVLVQASLLHWRVVKPHVSPIRARLLHSIGKQLGFHVPRDLQPLRLSSGGGSGGSGGGRRSTSAMSVLLGSSPASPESAASVPSSPSRSSAPGSPASTATAATDGIDDLNDFDRLSGLDRHSRVRKLETGRFSYPPLLAGDMFATLVRLVVLWPRDPLQDYRMLVRLCYTPLLVQAVLSVHRSQVAARATGTAAAPKSPDRIRTLPDLYAFVVAAYAGACTPAPPPLATLTAELVSMTLPFLRCASLLLHAGFLQDAPTFPADYEAATEHAMYATYLELPPLTDLGSTAWLGLDHIPSWIKAIPSALLASPDAQVLAVMRAKRILSLPAHRRLVGAFGLRGTPFEMRPELLPRVLRYACVRLPLPHAPRPFRLIELPHLFQDLFQRLVFQTCETCGTVPSQPGLCLLCGAFVCVSGKCCKTNHNRGGEASQHSLTCCAGTCAYFMLKQCNIILFCERKVSWWGSPYLDDHGEEDPGLKRGRPLYFAESRYVSLQQAFVNHKLVAEIARNSNSYTNRLEFNGL